ncbi:hypothetical protein [Bacillus horti]|uniref:Uncharacterized protein n=1 Tax=Caldalkalibacillus horti TaxID=77523 RepID=A0ABT9W2D1_9BACI|nr:hypothetical protein [Bacillus horti]MDQ0167270.1 hypothetical protein [Bacillus horti]
MARIELYRQYRQVQVGLHTKILNDYVHENEFKQAAELLGILDKQNRVVIESDADKDALYDFNIYGKIRDGKSTLSLFADNYSSINQLENELLTAMLQSEASLYEVIDIDKKEGMIILNDIFSNKNQPIKLIDLSLSNSTKQSTLIYTRLHHLKEFSITSGLGFIFSENHRDYILNRSRKMLKKMKTGDTSNDRFIVFFQLNRSDGLPILFEKVK